MSKSDTFENDLLKLIFNNTAVGLVGDSPGLQPSATVGSLYVALHTADPGEAGNQSTNEVAYTFYSRVAVARTSGGWTVAGNSVSPTAAISFPTCGATGATAAYASIGTASSGTGKILYSGALTPNIAISNGVTPTIPTSSTITED